MGRGRSEQGRDKSLVAVIDRRHAIGAVIDLYNIDA
jgi:hypothetical protein